MINYLAFAALCFITLFHVYMGLGGKLNYDYVLPKIGTKPLPFHSSMALPVAALLAITTIAYGFELGLYTQFSLGTYNQLWLMLAGAAFLFRGIFGLVVFHGFNKIIDNTPFKTWDLKLYSPLTVFLGCSILNLLGLI